MGLGQGHMEGVAQPQTLPGSPTTGSGLTRTLIQIIPSTVMSMRLLMMNIKYFLPFFMNTSVNEEDILYLTYNMINEIS